MSASNLTFQNGLTILPQQSKVIIDGEEVVLSKREYAVLYLLARHPGWIFSKEQIYEAIWNENSDTCFNAVTNTISRLRKKMKMEGSQKDYIQTVFGYGYKFSQE